MSQENHLEFTGLLKSSVNLVARQISKYITVALQIKILMPQTTFIKTQKSHKPLDRNHKYLWLIKPSIKLLITQLVRKFSTMRYFYFCVTKKLAIHVKILNIKIAVDVKILNEKFDYVNGFYRFLTLLVLPNTKLPFIILTSLQRLLIFIIL